MLLPEILFIFIKLKNISMKRHFIYFLVVMFFSHNVFAQQINYIDSSQHGVSFRGLSVVNDSTLWVSGSKGTVGKSLNGGKIFEWMKPKGFENRDFRDIEAFDSKTAIIKIGRAHV